MAGCAVFPLAKIAQTSDEVDSSRSESPYRPVALGAVRQSSSHLAQSRRRFIRQNPPFSKLNYHPLKQVGSKLRELRTKVLHSRGYDFVYTKS
jgi:hypothetical protein